ncbi:hypothetical protein PC118_g20473 [Phytophthora cactorum]|uniref:Uncharacterized protein n=1 Tax=Phytophthora cactorum TaxID=29920 RepID=A0A8T1F9P6_9STRA|nr:hypothetical protein PC118_g20473 [Phytophthora cactorum]
MLEEAVGQRFAYEVGPSRHCAGTSIQQGATFSVHALRASTWTSLFERMASRLYFHEDLNMLMAMNDISETSLQLTFIIQITMIGRAVSVKVKVRSIVWFTNVAEGFIILGWLNVFACILDAAGMITGEGFRVFGNVLESVALVFVLVFRFFYLSLSLGFRTVYAERKLEFLIYVLLVIHEFPFAMIKNGTGVSWEFPQAICHRVLMVSCIVLNIRHKARNNSRSNNTVKSSANRSAAISRGRGSFLKTLTTKLNTGTAHSTFPDIAKVAVTTARVEASTDESYRDS